MNRTRTRKLRRQNRQKMKHGRKAKPTHKVVSGRTGGVHTKKLKSRQPI